MFPIEPIFSESIPSQQAYWLFIGKMFDQENIVGMLLAQYFILAVFFMIGNLNHLIKIDHIIFFLIVVNKWW